MTEFISYYNFIFSLLYRSYAFIYKFIYIHSLRLLLILLLLLLLFIIIILLISNSIFI